MLGACGEAQPGLGPAALHRSNWGIFNRRFWGVFVRRRQLDLFDERNLLELSSPDYPGERLVACRNPQLAKLRTHKREELLAATEASLEKIKARVDAGKLAGQDEIGLRVGKVINQYKMAKHFELVIGENAFNFAHKREALAAEAALDGLYIIRTSVPAAQMQAPQCVRNYKSLANVERAFRSLKTIDRKRVPNTLLTRAIGQMSWTWRSSPKPTRQLVPSPVWMVAVRWLMRTMVPTTVLRYLSSKATFSPQRKSLRAGLGGTGVVGCGCGRAAVGAGGSMAA
jgi:hypothetical protein